jgi:hypothetical protein
MIVNPLSSVYNKLYSNMLSMNSTRIGLEVALPRAQGEKPKTCIFYLTGLFSGDKKKLIDDQNSSTTVATIKLRMDALSKSTYDTQNPTFGILTAPTSNLKAFVVSVFIDEKRYIITQETQSGFSFSDVIILKLERKQ